MKTFALLLAAGLLAAASGARAEGAKPWAGAPRYVFGDFEIKPRGRVLLDAARRRTGREGPAPASVAAEARARQVFVGVEGEIGRKWSYKAEGGLADGDDRTWDEVVLEHRPVETLSLQAGNLKAAGLENATSTRFTSFTDRGPYGSIVADGYSAGVLARLSGRRWSLTGAMLSTSLNRIDLAGADEAAERLGFTARAVFAPAAADGTLVHVGVWARRRDRGDRSPYAYSAKPNTSFGAAVIGAGGVGDRDSTLAVEAALVRGPVSVQAEWARIEVDRLRTAVLDGGDPTVAAGYVFALWSVTGEPRAYDARSGVFGRPRVARPLGAGGWGGLEVGLRYDFADLSDVHASAATPAARAQAGKAGRYQAVTIGVNHHPFPHARIMAGYTRASIDNPAPGGDLDIDQAQLRLQFDF